jgi:hypothetical protein
MQESSRPQVKVNLSNPKVIKNIFTSIKGGLQDVRYAKIKGLLKAGAWKQLNCKGAAFSQILKIHFWLL